jgi:hypothetical protein
MTHRARSRTRDHVLDYDCKKFLEYLSNDELKFLGIKQETWDRLYFVVSNESSVKNLFKIYSVNRDKNSFFCALKIILEQFHDAVLLSIFNDINWWAEYYKRRKYTMEEAYAIHRKDIPRCRCFACMYE